MPRRRYYKRTANKDKYSIEQSVIKTPASWEQVAAIEGTQASYQTALPIVEASDLQGMRKVKHLTISFSSNSDALMIYALVYVPAGYQPNDINYPAVGSNITTYEPNQYVISTGVLDFSGGPLRIRSPLARNLNSGDAIALILASESVSPTVLAQVRYAITLQ